MEVSYNKELINRLEEESGVTIKQSGIPRITEMLYHEAREAFVHGLYHCTVLAAAAAIESFLVEKIPAEDFTNVPLRSNGKKKKLDPKGLHYLLSFLRLAEIAKNKKMISSNITEEILFVKTVRDNINHPRFPFFSDDYRFKVVSYKGTGTHSRTISFESPTKKPIIGQTIDKEAFNALKTLLGVVKDFKTQNAPKT